MKQQVSPMVVAIALVVVLGVAVVAWMKMGGVENRIGEKPPGMPEHAAAKWAEMTKAGPGQSGSSVPSLSGGGPGGTTPSGAGGAMMPTGPGGSSVPTGPGGMSGGSIPTGPPMGR
jgi:hypothetical protein